MAAKQKLAALRMKPGTKAKAAGLAAAIGKKKACK